MSSYHYSFYSPTECTAWVFSHRFHCLLRIFSHRFHRFTQKLGCLQGGALVSSAPTEQNRYSPTESTEPTELLAECIPPQIAQIYTEVRLPSRGCTCLKCTNQARSAPTEQYRYTSCYVGALETSAPPEISRFCEFCVFCGRTTVCSVGALETSAPPENSICEICGRTSPSRRFCEFCEICGRISHSRRFCEFRVFCGRPLKGAVAEAGIPPLRAGYSK